MSSYRTRTGIGCVIVFTFLRWGAGDIALQRYGSLDLDDKLLLKQRLKEIVASDRLSACRKWLMPEVVGSYDELAKAPEFSATVAKARRIVKADGFRLFFGGNHFFVMTEMIDGEGGSVRAWWIRLDTWRIRHMEGVTRGSLSRYIIKKEDFLRENPVLLPILQELVVADRIYSAGKNVSAKPLLFLCTEESLRDAANENEFLTWVSEPQLRAANRQVRKYSKDYRACRFIVKEVQKYGNIIRIWYCVPGYRDGLEDLFEFGRSNPAYAYLHELRDGEWVLGSARDRSNFAAGE